MIKIITLIAVTFAIYQLAMSQNCNTGFCTGTQVRVPIVNFTATSNGCGPEDFSGLVPEFNFGDCCDVHDLCYANCSLDKTTCDERFYQCMLRRCDSLSGFLSSVRERLCRNVAECYAATVYDEGCPFYEENQQRACTCEDGDGSAVVETSSKSFKDLSELNCVFVDFGAANVNVISSSVVILLVVIVSIFV